jgi:hypothetical protein
VRPLYSRPVKQEVTDAKNKTQPKLAPKACQKVKNALDQEELNDDTADGWSTWTTALAATVAVCIATALHRTSLVGNVRID